MDYSMAFDEAPQGRLVCKVILHGIQGELAYLIQNGLSARSQRVFTKGYFSDWRL